MTVAVTARETEAWSAMSSTSYDPNPRYALASGRVEREWAPLAAGLPSGPVVLRVDGPVHVDWALLIPALTSALAATGRSVQTHDVADLMRPWSEVVDMTSTPTLRDDQHFEALPSWRLADLFASPPSVPPSASAVTVCFGPGAALLRGDVLWYVDVPKRFAEAGVAAGSVHNLGQRPSDGPALRKRTFYIDWPLQDAHRDAIVADVDQWIDGQDLAGVRSVAGPDLRATLARLARLPFRTRPTFNTAVWGGTWGQTELGMNRDRPNSALGYELIAPEAGILLGDSAADVVEVPFQMMVSLHPRAVLGAEVHDRFGTSFPIRFDYLDTLDGGSLSVHCHPETDYMRDVFGWPYPQHETYYMMHAEPGSHLYLGLTQDADLADFRRRAHDADDHQVPFEITDFVQTFPAEPHQIYLVPAGTPHGSGVGNVVLEVSATPYLYSLRFYDWLRRDADGGRRPVHVEHAFANLGRHRSGAAVRADLVPSAQTVGHGSGWREELLAASEEMFFDVRRLDLEADAVAEQVTADRFHVLNVVDGSGVRITTRSGVSHQLHYAETLVVPGSVDRYTVTAGGGPVRLVKALVR